jgi:hypothetical protein
MARTAVAIPLPPLIAFLRRTRWYVVVFIVLAASLPATWSLAWPIRLFVSLLALAWIDASGAYKLWHSFRSGYREPTSN